MLATPFDYQTINYQLCFDIPPLQTGNEESFLSVDQSITCYALICRFAYFTLLYGKTMFEYIFVNQLK